MPTGPTVRRNENGRHHRAPRPSRRGLPLVVYVAMLILVPLLGVGLLSFREVTRNSAASDAARRVESAIGAQSAAIKKVDQLAYVARKGVTRAQGFLLARPAPAAAATALMFSGPMIDVDEMVPVSTCQVARPESADV